jgi:predicted RNase H-like HicB family nuclease
MKIKAIIEEGKSGVFSIYAPDLKMHAINGQGKTVNEAKEDFINSFRQKGKLL